MTKKPFDRWSYDEEAGTLAYDDGDGNARLVLGDEYPRLAELLNEHRVAMTEKVRRR